jgi:hypothetical protein
VSFLNLGTDPSPQRYRRRQALFETLEFNFFN